MLQTIRTPDGIGASDLGNGATALLCLEQLVVPAFVLSRTGHVVLWNQACARITGVLASEVTGTKTHWRAFYETERPCLADLILAGRVDEAEYLYLEQVRRDEDDGSLHCENWCVLPRTGQRLYLGFDVGPVYDQTGQIIAVLETFRNMTSDKVRQTKLHRLASTDALTGLANRRRFDEALEQLWVSAKANHEPISLLMIDIDHFKSYNDCFGHQEGDICIKSVAQVISDHMFRASDVAARYGGEEFAVILPATPIEGAAAVADRIRRAICASRSSDEAFSAAAGDVTVSIGIASCVPGLYWQATDILTCADSALYEAKHKGRNRIVMAPVEKPSRLRQPTWRAAR